MFRRVLLVVVLAGCAARPSAPPPPVTPAEVSHSYYETNLVWMTQWELNRLLYYKGTLDGAMGPSTATAIRSFEAANDMPVDGAPSSFLLDRLRQTPSGK